MQQVSVLVFILVFIFSEKSDLVGDKSDPTTTSGSPDAVTCQCVKYTTLLICSIQALAYYNTK